MRYKRLTIGLLGIALFATHTLAWGQLGMRTGVKAGYGWATLSGDNVSDVESRKVLMGGLSLELSVLGLLNVQADLMYSPRGAQTPAGEKTELTYLSIPVVLKMKFLPVGIHPYILAGPELGFLISAKAAGHDIKDDCKSQDLGIVGGVGLEFSLLGKSVMVEARYYYGLNSINKDDAVSVKNRVSQILVGLLF